MSHACHSGEDLGRNCHAVGCDLQWTLTGGLALQNRKTWTADLFSAIDMFCRHRTVSNEIRVDDRLEVWGAWAPNDPWNNSCFFSLSDLELGESFRFFFHG